VEDKDKTKEQLANEISDLRQRISMMAAMGDKLRRTEKMLEECESRYRDLVENADIAILIDDEEGKFVYFNDKFTKLFGYTRDEMREQSISSLAHPDDAEQIMHYHKARLSGKDVPARYEFRGKKKDGSIIYLEVDAVPLKMGEKIVGTRSYLWDVGAHKKMEQELQGAQADFEKRVEERTAELTNTNVLLEQRLHEYEEKERGLEESENRYNALYNQGALCVFIHDLMGQFIDANDAALNLLGYSREEIPQIHLSHLLDENQMKVARERLEEIKEHGHQKEVGKYRLRKKDGGFIWVETDAALLVRDGHPYAVQGIARDITRRIEAEQKLEKSEEEKAVIIDSMVEHVIYHSPELRIISANKAAAQSVDMSVEQLVGKHCYEIWHQRNDICPNCPVKKALETGSAHMNEMATPDGRKWFVRGSPVHDSQGNIIGAVEVTMDVTVLKKAEDALRESEEKYKTLTENVNVGIYRNSIGPKGKFIEANPAIVKMFGYGSKDEFLSISVSDLYQNPEGRKQFNEKMLEEGYVKNEELQLRKKDGAPIFVSVSAVAVKDAKEQVKYYDGIVEDITERKRAEQELQESYEKLQKVLNGTVHALASTTEKRDPYTAGHQHRVAQLACAIAEEMGYAEEELEGIKVAGIVHDIGKIYVAAEILNKPVKLKDIEMSLVKAHCQAGYEILRTVEFPWPVAEMVLQHHEKMNGTGYPAGLKGDEILPGARILAVADVVEAMLSHRPYRSALDMSDALEEITSNRGVLYDEKVVDACMRVFEKGFEFK
jgi:PAS domain S-box-containing protein/putative nucleotidyltransferase with HDIG domain